MYIHRALLLAACIIMVFLPSIGEWLAGSATAWHRPYLLWLFLVIAVYWNQRSRYPDEL